MSARDVTREAIVQSALLSAELAEEIGLPRNRIILSAKVSQVQDLIAVYSALSQRSNHALHLGLTEAGMGSKGIVASSAYVVVVPKNSPATDLKSLVAHVNKGDGKLNYSTVGVGSTQHLIAEDLRQRTGMNAKQLSFRKTGEVVTALLRGDAAFAVELIHAVRGQVDAGELRLIAVSTPERWPSS